MNTRFLACLVMFLGIIAPMPDLYASVSYCQSRANCDRCSRGTNTELSEPILFVGSTCHFCKEVLNFLDSKSARSRVIIRDAWRNERAKRLLRKLTGKSGVPCLVFGSGDYAIGATRVIQRLKKFLKTS